MPRQTVCKAAAIALPWLLGLACHGPATRAEVTPDPHARPDAGVSTAVQKPQPGWPSLQSLLKLPDWMHLGLELSSEPLAGVNPARHPAGSSAWIQQLEISSAFSPGLNKPIETWGEADHWMLNLALNSFNGNPNLNLALGAAFPLQTAAHPVGLWLSEATLQRRRGNAAIDIKAGLLPLNPSFVEAETLNHYIHSALNNTLNLLIPGLPINPFVAPGAELRWQMAPGHELRMAGYWLDSETALASMLGVNPVQPDVQGTLQIVQWNLSDLPGSKAVADPIGNGTGAIARQLPNPLLQLGAFTTTASSNLYPAGANQGVYGSLTLPTKLPIGLDNRLWVAFNSGLNSAANPFPVFVAGGWLNQGLIPGRPLDVLALGFGRTSFSPQLSAGSHESVLELNYAININAQLSVQPLLQWIVNPGGGSGGAYATGVQINLSL